MPCGMGELPALQVAADKAAGGRGGRGGFILGAEGATHGRVLNRRLICPADGLEGYGGR